MNDFSPYLSWIDSQQSRMVSLVTRWANINSGTYHLAGLHHLSQAIQLEFACLKADSVEHLQLPVVALQLFRSASYARSCSSRCLDQDYSPQADFMKFSMVERLLVRR